MVSVTYGRPHTVCAHILQHTKKEEAQAWKTPMGIAVMFVESVLSKSWSCDVVAKDTMVDMAVQLLRKRQQLIAKGHAAQVTIAYVSQSTGICSLILQGVRARFKWTERIAV